MLFNWDQTTAPSLTKATIITTVRMTVCPPSQEISHFINIYEHVSAFYKLEPNKIHS